MPDSIVSTDHDPTCAVLVMSCDAYSDLWTPFFNLFWRYWPDCPWPVYLGANSMTFSDSRVVMLQAGDAEWSARLRFCIERLRCDFVLLLLEDYFIDRPVATSLMREMLSAAATLGAMQLRVFPSPGPNRRIAARKDIGALIRAAEYRVSTQAAFWNRKHLSELLVDEESIWEFEWRGTERSRRYETGYYATYEPVIRYWQVVERGVWFRAAAEHFEKQQIGCDFNARRIMSGPTATKRAVTTTLRRWRSTIKKIQLRGEAH